MWKKKCGYVILLTYLVSCIVQLHAEAQAEGSSMRASGRVVRKEERRPVVSTDYGQISAVRINDAINGSYLLHFFSLEPNALLLPLLLKSDMLLYVHAGSGRLSWTEEDELKHIDLKRGDVYRLLRGTVFYIITQSQPQQQQQQQQTLNIHAIFSNSNDDLREPAATVDPYLSVQDIVLGFDKNILQATFKVSEEVIDELLGATKPPPITNVDTICRGFSETRSCNILKIDNKKKKKDDKKEKEKEKEKKHERLFNLFEVEKEVENCNGWATAVRKQQLPALEGSNIGVFIVSLKAGSMMEPRWDTTDTEIVVVLEGRGAVRMFSPSITKEAAEGRNVGFEVAEGDVFAMPTFSPAAEMAFNNGSFVFMGFMKERNKGQSIAGGDSVLQFLSKDVLQILFNVKSTTLDEILAPGEDTVISACTSCAEKVMRTKGREEETGGHRRHGGDEGKEREESRHGREEEERQREEEGREEERQREEEARWRHHHGEAEEEAPWRRGGEREPQRQNHHNYEQGGRRILKRN